MPGCRSQIRCQLLPRRHKRSRRATLSKYRSCRLSDGFTLELLSIRGDIEIVLLMVFGASRDAVHVNERPEPKPTNYCLSCAT